MKNIFFITTLLLGSQIAFGMDKDEPIKTISNHPEIESIRYINSDDSKTYAAILKNSEDIIFAVFFITGPGQGYFDCRRATVDENGAFCFIALDNSTYDQLRTLYEAEKD